METLAAINAAAKGLFDRIGIKPEDTNWESITDEIPDDVYPEEDGQQPVEATDAAEFASLTD